LSSKYPPWAVEATWAIGVSQLSPREFLGDLTSLIAEDADAFHSRAADWHSQLAAALVRMTADADLMPFIMDMPIIPLQDGSWTPARGHTIFFSKAGTDLEMPSGIEVLIVEPTAESDPNRRNLFASLGVKAWETTEICQLVLQVHSSPNFKPEALTTNQLVSHARFLWKASWQPPKNATLWFATTQEKRCLGSALYIFGNAEPGSSAARIFARLQNKFAVIHSSYLDHASADEDWPDWLVRHLGLSRIPRLIHPQVDPKPQPLEVLEVQGNEDPKPQPVEVLEAQADEQSNEGDRGARRAPGIDKQGLEDYQMQLILLDQQNKKKLTRRLGSNDLEAIGERSDRQLPNSTRSSLDAPAPFRNSLGNNTALENYYQPMQPTLPEQRKNETQKRLRALRPDIATRQAERAPSKKMDVDGEKEESDLVSSDTRKHGELELPTVQEFLDLHFDDFWGNPMETMDFDSFTREGKVEQQREKPKTPVDLERQCGVLLPNGQPCARSLTCKSHTVTAKRAVLGRSTNFDTLLAALSGENRRLKQMATIDDAALLKDKDSIFTGLADSDGKMTEIIDGRARQEKGPAQEPTKPQFESVEITKLFELSDEFRSMLLECSTSDVLHLLRDNWLYYSQWIDGVHMKWQSPDFLKSCAELRISLRQSVVQSARGPVQLQHTVLPNIDAELEDGFPIPAVPIEDASHPDWRLLSHFGVTVSPDAEYYLRCLTAIAGNAAPDVDKVAYIYEKIQSRYRGNEQSIKYVFAAS
jgi:hypothetical protein